jgi:hypothetical protein
MALLRRLPLGGINLGSAHRSEGPVDVFEVERCFF